MNRFVLSLFFSCIFLIPSPAQQTITWPIPSTAPDANSAAIAEPRIDWLQRFQTRIDGAKKKPAIDIIFDGDSITDFWEGNGKAVWVSHYLPLNAYDFGVSGDRTENLLWRLQNHQVDNLHPKLIILMIGTNNLSGNSADQIADGVKAVVTEYTQLCPDSAILLLGIFPRAEKPTDPLREKIKAVNQIISQLADGKKINYLDIGDKFLQPDGTISKEVLYDFLHPSLKGYQIWADAIQPIVDKYVPATAAAAPPATPPGQ